MQPGVFCETVQLLIEKWRGLVGGIINDVMKGLSQDRKRCEMFIILPILGMVPKEYFLFMGLSRMTMALQSAIMLACVDIKLVS